MEPGIYNISNEEYHSSEGLSRSAIMQLRRSPYHFWGKYISKTDTEKVTSSALNIGNAVHTLVLEPELFMRDYKILDPDINLMTKAGREIRDSYISEGKIVLKYDEYQLALNMQESVLEKASFLLDGCDFEKSIYWYDKDYEILCKSRPDVLYLKKDAQYFADLKTTMDASPWSFEKAVFDYGYHIQAAMQQEAALAILNILVKDFYFIVVEKEAPYATAIYQLQEDALEIGRKEFKKALALYKQCKETDKWDSYPIRTVGLPYYAYYNN